MNFLDPIGAVFSLLSTIFFVKANKQAWPLGIVATMCNMTLYFQRGIYGDAALEIFYFLLMFYGWHLWSRGKEQQRELPITHLTMQQGILWVVVASVSIPCLAWLLIRYAHSSVPWLDATTTIVSLIAQWLMCRKIIETWLLWFIADAIYAGMYFYKGIPFHSALLMVYLGMAIAGYITWSGRSSQQTYTSIPC